jgi:acyl-CoA synthetase (AMP-forming)/AMP-acid ligase II
MAAGFADCKRGCEGAEESFWMLDFQTINDVFVRMSHRGDTTVAQWRDHGEWKPISSKQMYGRVRATVALLQKWGIQRGDRVALVSENRWEWPVVDFAILAIGAVAVPLYQTSERQSRWATFCATAERARVLPLQIRSSMDQAACGRRVHSGAWSTFAVVR